MVLSFYPFIKNSDKYIIYGFWKKYKGFFVKNEIPV